MGLRSSIAILLSGVVLCFAQIPPDSISFNYFYRNELNEILRLKKTLKHSDDSLKVWQLLAKTYDNMNIDSVAIKYHYKILRELRKNGNTQEYTNYLFEIHYAVSSKKNYGKDDRLFLQEYESYARQSNDDKMLVNLWKQTAEDYYVDSIDTEKARPYFDSIMNTNTTVKSSKTS